MMDEMRAGIEPPAATPEAATQREPAEGWFAPVSETLFGRVRSSRLAQHAGDIADVAVALALAAAAVVTLATATVDATTGRAADPLGYALGLLLTLPLAARRRWPLAVFGTVFIGLVVFDSREYAGQNVDFFGPVLAFYTVAAHRPRRDSLITAGLLGLTVLAAVLFAPPQTDGAASVLTVVLVVGGVWLLGDTARSRRIFAERLEQQTRALREARLELAERAVTQERLRIARELHDVVAHHMSAVVVQAALAQERLGTAPEEARRAMVQVEGIGRRALREMRQILGVLRQAGEDQGALLPAPSMSDLDGLYSRARDGGLVVHASVQGEPMQAPPAVQLAVYRVVQEGLTNALKHAPGASVQVHVRQQAGTIQVELVDDGAGRGPRLAPDAMGAGQGLAGMRERVGLLHGTCEAGPRPGGGFRIAATLPLEVPL